MPPSPLTPSSLAWKDILKGANYDASNDQQSSSNHDIVGNEKNAALQGQTSGSGDATMFYFRARMGDDVPRTSVMLGLDLNQDGRFDVFVEANVRDSSSSKFYISLHKSDPSKSGVSPSTTGWLNSSNDTNVERPLAAANTYLSVAAAGGDLDANGKTDYWITFGFSFGDLKAFVHSALGIETFSADTPVTMSVFTSGGQTANGDVAGVSGISSKTWDSLGILTTNTLTEFASGAPAAPTIDASSTSNPKPTLSGTWGGSNGGSDTLTVTVNGTGYTTATTPALSIVGTNWTLELPGVDVGSYDITATVKRSEGTTSETTLSRGLNVVAAGDVTGPTLLKLSPEEGASDVGVGSNLVMTFSEDVVAGSGSITLLQGSNIVEVFNLRSGMGSFGGTATISGDTVVVNPGVLLAVGTSYTLQLDADAVADASGNAFVGDSLVKGWAFTTGKSLGAPDEPRVATLVTNAKDATISGSWGGSNAGTDTLSVTVDGTTYTTAKGLVVSGTSWSLALPTLSDGTYSVTATASRSGGSSVSNTTSKELVIDTAAPSIASFDMTGSGITSGGGAISSGSTVTITLTGDEALVVTGVPTLTLNNGGTATYTGGSGTNALTFTYTVGAGDTTAADLTVTAVSAGIKDAAGNALSTSNLGIVGNPAGTLAVTAICYLRGTMILTDRGEVPIETLAIGDTVVTRRGGLTPIKWIGRQSFGGNVVDWRGAPVRISAGALGAGMPRRDLWISPGHSMLVGETLLMGHNLVNGVTIVQDASLAQVDYFQIELEAHDCVLAEGAWSETYADCRDLRRHFHNADTFHALYPDHVAPETVALCAPRPETGAALDAALRPLVARVAETVSPGPLNAWIDRVSDTGRVSGWAMDMANPHLPVLLEVVLGEEVLGTVLAANYRHDLFVAGIARGRCGYVFEADRRLSPEERLAVTVRRACDGAAARLPVEARVRILEDHTPAVARAA